MLFKVTSIDVDKEKQTLIELYRDPNLSIEKIKELEVELNEKIRKVREHQNELISIRIHLKSNNFQPNDQETFGVLTLNEFSNDLALSSILSRVQSNELTQLCEFSLKDKFTLLYKANRDGFGAKDFHLKCDGHENTLTILKATKSSFIFGGYTTVSWDSSKTVKSDPNAFIFSLTNGDNEPVKMKIGPYKHEYAIFCDSDDGPTFGDDITIVNNANTTMDSYSDLGCAYKHPQYAFETNEAKTFLAGSYKFQLSEIEIYKKD